MVNLNQEEGGKQKDYKDEEKHFDPIKSLMFQSPLSHGNQVTVSHHFGKVPKVRVGCYCKL